MPTPSGPPARRPDRFRGRLFPSVGCAVISLLAAATVLVLALAFDFWIFR